MLLAAISEDPSHSTRIFLTIYRILMMKNIKSTLVSAGRISSTLPQENLLPTLSQSHDDDGSKEQSSEPDKDEEKKYSSEIVSIRANSSELL